MGLSRRQFFRRAGVGYVAVNAPPEGLEEEAFELQPSWIFEAK